MLEAIDDVRINSVRLVDFILENDRDKIMVGFI